MIKYIHELSKEGIHLSYIDNKLKIFSKETVSAEIVEEIKSKKQEIIDYFLSNVVNVKKDYLVIKPIAPQSDYTVSEGQKMIWMIAQNTAKNIGHNMAFSFEFSGNIHHLEKALLSIINRHESLRTVFFVNEENQLRQKVKSLQDLQFNIHHIDARQQEDAYRFIKESIISETTQPFDLEHGPLLKIIVFKTHEKYICHYIIHHIICDGWSFGILKKEIDLYYRYHNEGIIPELPELTIQYKDYAEWEHFSLDSKEAGKYWNNRISEPVPSIVFPFQKTGNLSGSQVSQKLEVWIPEEKIQPLKSFCKLNETGLFTGLLTAWNILIHKYTALETIVLGTPCAMRDNIDLMHQVGYYINLLPLKNSIDSDETVKNLFSRIKDSTRDDFDRKFYPFNKIVEGLEIGKSSEHPLFNILITLHNIGEGHIEEHDTLPYEITLRDEINPPKYNMDIEYQELNEGLIFSINYNSELYLQKHVKALMEHYLELINHIFNEPELRIGEISLLTIEESNQILEEFNATKAYFPKDKTVIDLFEEQVQLTPDTISVRDFRKSLTYKELKEKTDQVASFLIADLGLGNESVGVMSNRSVDLIVLLLGIMKAGKSYIPIDPVYPEERINYIIRQSEVSLIVTEDCFKDDLIKNNDYSGVKFITKEELFSQDVAWDLSLNNTPAPEDTAYIIYTSGSTGVPKGVEIGHYSLTNFLTSMQNTPGINTEDVLYSVGSYSFDISILEFFTPLIAGASLFISGKETLSNVETLKKELDLISPSIIQATPSFYQLLFNAGWKGNANIKVLCGGDYMPQSIAEKLIACSKEAWQMYGPTETTVWSTVKKLEKPSDASNIGKPINNTQIYILDTNYTIAPLHVPGRIFIAGDGLAKGYYKNEELTHGKFVDNPFSENTKMYETGDVGKWNEKGEIEFLGRNDSQVKIRGFRIELGEIETKLLENKEKIKYAIVEAREVHEEKALVAYCVVPDGHTLDKTELRKYLQERLPQYMIPDFFVQMKNIPLTPNGKVDRKALPAVTENDMIVREYFPPRNKIEQKLVEIWQDVLGVKKVGITDNFFELGGHSIKSVALVSQLRKNGLDISYQDVLSAKDIQSLASYITHTELEADDVNENPIPEKQLDFALFFNYSYKKTVKNNLIVIHDGTGEIAGYHELLNKITDHYNIWCFSLHKENLAPVDVTPENMAMIYADQIKEAFDTNENVTIIGWSYGGYISYLIAEYFEKQNNAFKKLVMIDTYSYTDEEDESIAEKAFFTLDHQFSLEKEKQLIQTLIPSFPISGFSEISTIGTFWQEVQKKIENQYFDYHIPEFVQPALQNRNNGDSLYDYLALINKLRTIFLHLPQGKTKIIDTTEVCYIKAKESSVKHLNYWKENTNGHVIVKEIEGTHGSIMNISNVQEIILFLENIV